VKQLKRLGIGEPEIHENRNMQSFERPFKFFILHVAVLHL